MMEHSAILFTCIKLPRGFKTFVLSTVKPVLGGHLERRPKIGFQDRLLLNAGQKYCRMLQGEHSAILLTFLKQPFAIDTFLLSIFEWPLKTCFTVFLSGRLRQVSHCTAYYGILSGSAVSNDKISLQ